MSFISSLVKLRPVLSFLGRVGRQLLNFAVEYVRDLDKKDDLTNEQKRKRAVAAIIFAAERFGKSITPEDAERLIKVAILIVRFVG